jgi:hypothetical protein
VCMIEYADCSTETISKEIRKARKPHRCGECHREIGKGELYERYTHKTDGSFGVEVTCGHCHEACAWLLRECHGYMFGKVEEDLREHWHEDGINTRELAALIWGMKRKWKRRDGRLMALPTLRPKEEVHHGE